MSELIDLQKLDADAINAAKNGLDPEKQVKAWPECARLDWMSKYYFALEVLENERAEQAA